MRALAAVLLTLILSSCVLNSAPKDNVAFGDVSSLQQLQGNYQNAGIGGGAAVTYLSAIIWPDPKLDHKGIDRVLVTARNTNTLLVQAYSANSVVKEGVFVEGKDFHLANGRLHLKRDVSILGFRAGEPILGAGYENVEIGLDGSGQGKYQQDFAVAGLVFALFPAAFVGSSEVRFVKLQSK